YRRYPVRCRFRLAITAATANPSKRNDIHRTHLRGPTVCVGRTLDAFDPSSPTRRACRSPRQCRGFPCCGLPQLFSSTACRSNALLPLAAATVAWRIERRLWFFTVTGGPNPVRLILNSSVAVGVVLMRHRYRDASHSDFQRCLVDR